MTDLSCCADWDYIIAQIPLHQTRLEMNLQKELKFSSMCLQSKMNNQVLGKSPRTRVRGKKEIVLLLRPLVIPLECLIYFSWLPLIDTLRLTKCEICCQLAKYTDLASILFSIVHMNANASLKMSCISAWLFLEHALTLTQQQPDASKATYGKQLEETCLSIF
jgi:hypothetical protein